jgi:hypothetical protein
MCRTLELLRRAAGQRQCARTSIKSCRARHVCPDALIDERQGQTCPLRRIVHAHPSLSCANAGVLNSDYRDFHKE